MLLLEWNTEDAIAFAREEGREEGWEKGRGEGMEAGLERGRMENLAIVRNMLAENMSPEFVQKLTGLDMETIGKLTIIN